METWGKEEAGRGSLHLELMANVSLEFSVFSCCLGDPWACISLPHYLPTQKARPMPQLGNSHTGQDYEHSGLGHHVLRPGVLEGAPFTAS